MVKPSNDETLPAHVLFPRISANLNLLSKGILATISMPKQRG